MKHDKIDLFCNRSYRTGLIKRARRYVKIRAVRFTRQKRRSVDIVAGSRSCFEERKRTRRLKHQIARAGKRHISTGMIANAAARLRPFMPLVAHGFSFCLAPLHPRRGAARRFMFAWAGVFYCRIRSAALGFSAGSCGQLICRRLFACPPVEVFGTGFIYFARFAVRHRCAASKVPIDKIKSA